LQNRRYIGAATKLAFYDLSKEERARLVAEIQSRINDGLSNNKPDVCVEYFADADTYIRKAAYLSIGRIFVGDERLQKNVISALTHLKNHRDELVRQTVVNAAGEIGIFQFESVQRFFDEALFDSHHKVRNAVIGSLKKMAQKNPSPALDWAMGYLNHPEKEVRREICHGIELRGRTHPEDVLPLLELLQDDSTKRVRDTLVHVIGQISYKEGCLAKVVSAICAWNNRELVHDAAQEIIDVHSDKRYAKFAALSQKEVIAYLSSNLKQ